MNVKISIGAGVSPRLQQSAQRQIDYKLGPMSESLSWIKVGLLRELQQEPVASEDNPVFVCQMQAQLSDGTRHEVKTRGLQPNVCIADTASRLARAITRRDRRAATSKVTRVGLG